MKKVRLDTSLEKEGQILDNTSVTENSNDKVKMENILLNAVANGDHEKLNNLLESGISVEAENLRQSLHFSTEKCGIPLHTAAILGHVKCLEILIKYGANVGAKGKFDCTALHFAAGNGHYQCLKLLLKAGADCCAPMNMALSGSVIPFIKGNTPLHLAAYYKQSKCIKELIESGADCSAVNMNGYTSLYIAAEAGYRKCVLTHLKYASGSSFLSLPSFESCNTPLHFAVKHGMLECVEHLIRLGADVNHINSNGFSPLHMACYSDIHLRKDIRMQIVKTIVLEGYNTDMNNALHQSLFDDCCPEVIAFLLTFGASLNLQSERNSLTFLERELNSQRNFDIIKFIVYCMLQLPPLKSLNMPFTSYSLSEVNITRNYFKIPEHAAIRLIQVEGDIYIDISDVLTEVIDTLQNINSLPVGSNSLHPQTKIVPLQQPFLNQVYEHVNNEIKNMYHVSFENNVVNNTPDVVMDQLLKLKKQLWYEQMALNPRSLKHCCRFSIRKCMGPTNLRRVKKLPLPRQLLSYLMFEYEELRCNL